MKFSNFLFPAAMTPELDHQIINESLREGQLCDQLGFLSSIHASLQEPDQLGLERLAPTGGVNQAPLG